ncbi:MAG: CBS domain-containing protein [Chloroflexi bacterium]|nr:CBS domain-containing protein [Chloroflexota bacterium]
MDVSQVMESNFRTVGLEETVAQAAQYMSEAGTGCLVVVDGDVPAGIITERDMVLGCLIDGHSSWECQVFRHMSIITEYAYPETGIGEALILMLDDQITFLPVVDEDKLVGLITSDSASRAMDVADEPQPIFSESAAGTF